MTRQQADGRGDRLHRNEKGMTIRQQNFIAAGSVADTIRTSLGPRGMDKMIEDSKGGVIITNDGATIMKEMQLTHPAAKMLVEMSRSQDIEAGDGTTSVVVFAGALLKSASALLDRGMHPQIVAKGFIRAADMADEALTEMSIPVNLEDRDALLKAAVTSFSSKVVSSMAQQLAPMAVDAVMKVLPDLKSVSNVDLSDIRVVKKVGGTIEDSELVDGLVLSDQRISRVAGGPTRIENAKIGLVQFCLSLPKPDIESTITIKDYQSMDRLLKQERLHIAKMVRQIAATGCNVLLIQKSILRDAVTDLALDFLARAKILVVRDIERDDIEFISRSLGCDPVASLDHFTTDRLGHASLVCEVPVGDSRLIKFTGINSQNTVTVLLRAAHGFTLDEADRSFHDALCVVRSIVKTKALVAGGGAPEMQMSTKLFERARTLDSSEQLCVRAFAEALEVVPATLAENAGVSPVILVTELRNRHNAGFKNAGIDVKRSIVVDDIGESLNVIQPLLVTRSAIRLATETAVMLLKIDDVVLTR